jgi:hypothetical protein
MNNTDLLDFYAGLALVGSITKYSESCDEAESKWLAETSFRYALAMLEERKKHVDVSDDD